MLAPCPSGLEEGDYVPGPGGNRFNLRRTGVSMMSSKELKARQLISDTQSRSDDVPLLSSKFNNGTIGKQEKRRFSVKPGDRRLRLRLRLLLAEYW